MFRRGFGLGRGLGAVTLYLLPGLNRYDSILE
jgi:hypothetical protein